MCCNDRFDYWRAIKAAWDSPELLVNVEHDMECADSLISELVDCPHGLCTFAYVLYWVSTGTGPHPAQRTAAGTWVAGREWVDYSGIGFCKIAPHVRRPLQPHDGAPEASWQHVDIAVNAAVTGQWHVHKEISHRHV